MSGLKIELGASCVVCPFRYELGPRARLWQPAGFDMLLKFDCLGADLQEYKFNLKTNRFLSAYVDGTNSTADFPYLSGGTCTKID